MSSDQNSVRLKRTKIPGFLGIGAGLAALVAVASVNPVLSLAGIAVLAFLWIGAIDSAPHAILANYLSFQWLQVTMTIWLADVLGIDLGIEQSVHLGSTPFVFNVPPDTNTAVALGLIALCALSIGFRFVAPRVTHFSATTSQIKAQKLVAGYLALLAVSLLTGPFVGAGLAQPLIVVGWLRFVPVVLLFLRWLTYPGTTSALLLVTGMEIVTGFLGYFSGFRNVFFIVAPVAIACSSLLRRSTWVALSAAFVFVLVLGAFWTSIKTVYRAELNRGSDTQTVALPLTERLDLLLEAAQNTSSENLWDGLAPLALRLSYTEYLADALGYVPAVVPHQGGRLWEQAIAN